MNDVALLVTAILLSIMPVVAILFYWRISRVNDEHEEARRAVGDITLSFGRKMRKQNNGISSVAERVDLLSSRNENLLRELDKHERHLETITAGAEKVLQSQSKMMAEVEAIQKRIREVASTQETLDQKIGATEEKVKHEIEELQKARLERTITRSKRRIVAPISIKREKALEPLTEYQIMILELLISEGEKTAPEMKQRIGITREHTARLMKRLYDEGYVERDMRKLPYVYRIKEEAREILKEE